MGRRGRVMVRQKGKNVWWWMEKHSVKKRKHYTKDVFDLYCFFVSYSDALITYSDGNFLLSVMRMAF